MKWFIALRTMLVLGVATYRGRIYEGARGLVQLAPWYRIKEAHQGLGHKSIGHHLLPELPRPPPKRSEKVATTLRFSLARSTRIKKLATALGFFLPRPKKNYKRRLLSDSLPRPSRSIQVGDSNSNLSNLRIDAMEPAGESPSRRAAGESLVVLPSTAELLRARRGGKVAGAECRLA